MPNGLTISKKVFCITGGSGFVGRHLIGLHALHKDAQIRFLTRQNNNPFANFPNVEPCHGNLFDIDSLRNFIAHDAVVLNLAYPGKTENKDRISLAVNNLIRVCSEKKISRMVHCSTAVVVGIAADDTITENTPCRPSLEYEKTKYQIEGLLQEGFSGNFPLIIARPTAIFGKGGKNLNKLIDDRKSESSLKSYLRKALYSNRTLNLVSVENVAQSLLFLATSNGPVNGETFIISDDDCPDNRYDYVVNRIEQIYGMPFRKLAVIKLPSAVLSLLLRMTGKSNFNPRRRYSPQKLKSLGPFGACSFNTTLEEYIRWYKNKSEA